LDAGDPDIFCFLSIITPFDTKKVYIIFTKSLC